MSQEIGKKENKDFQKKNTNELILYFRPDNNISTITMEEKDRFNEIKERLKLFLEYQVTNFRFSFPFGRPDGALKATLSLLERVLSKDIATPISRDDIRHFIEKCLENAAYINYTRVSDQAKIEGKK
jgi:hypothetical protein